MQISSKINVQFIKTLDKNWINYQELCSKEEHHVKCAIKEGFFFANLCSDKLEGLQICIYNNSLIKSKYVTIHHNIPHRFLGFFHAPM